MPITVPISRGMTCAVIDLLRLITSLLNVLRLLGYGYLLGSGALDDLVKFAPIKPDTAALRAVIDFHSLSIRHDEIDIITNWAFHGKSSLV